MLEHFSVETLRSAKASKSASVYSFKIAIKLGVGKLQKVITHYYAEIGVKLGHTAFCIFLLDCDLGIGRMHPNLTKSYQPRMTFG